MNTAMLTPIDDWTDCPFPFFDEPQAPVENYYKIYNDGGHFVGTRIYRKQGKPLKNNRNNTREDIDILFDSLYFNALNDGLKSAEITEYIKSGILKLFPNFIDLDSYIADKIKRKLHNLAVRKKRFRRKAYLNKWNYFVTFTYDDTKHTADSFREKLRKCLSNLHTRRGWRYMGVFEYAPDTQRVHFHGLLYVPDGEMLGRITEKKDYSTTQQKIQITHSNDFFAKNFGRNDFKEVDEMLLKHGNALNYILKYIGKTNERIVYSRGIPTVVCKKLKDTEIISDFTDFVTKYVLFDNVVDWEKDIMRFKRKQMSITDLLCNPPQVA